MQKSPSKSKVDAIPEWAANIYELRRRMDLSQRAFGQQLQLSAMAISRWERGALEPTAQGYIGLGNLAGDPGCWYFWSRAGLSNEDLMRVMPMLKRRLGDSRAIDFHVASAGPGVKKSKIPQPIAIPLLKCVAASHGEKGDNSAILHDTAVESMIAAPEGWCPNPASTICLRVRGNSMAPLISDGYILAVDSSQRDQTTLADKIVIAWHREMGLMVSRLRRFGTIEVLQPENREYQPIVLDREHRWKILAKVLWWIGRAD